MIATSTDAIGEIGTAATSIFSSIGSYWYLIIGIVLALFIAETIIDIMRGKRLDQEISETIERSREARDL